MSVPAQSAPKTKPPISRTLRIALATGAVAATVGGAAALSGNGMHSNNDSPTNSYDLAPIDSNETDPTPFIDINAEWPETYVGCFESDEFAYVVAKSVFDNPPTQFHQLPKGQRCPLDGSLTEESQARSGWEVSDNGLGR